MLKKLHTNQSLVIALDLCQHHYQNLLIIYLKFIAKNFKFKNCKSECEFKCLKVTNFLVIAKSLKKKTKKLKQINGLTEKFPNTYKFCNNDINKFVLLLRKGVYSYEYVDSQERFNEITLPNKEKKISRKYY